MRHAEELLALHDDYVWQVNAAVGEDRLDIAWQLADEYLDKALRLMSAGEPPGCGRPGCAVCERSDSAVAPARRGWLHRLLHAGAPRSPHRS
jgi:hypothetical protein